MSLSEELQKRITDMARSGLYENPRQIANALEEEGMKVSDNAVRNNLEKAGLYGLETVIGSNGEPIKKKVIRRSQSKG